MNNLIIGREKEQDELHNRYNSRRAEFVVVYGRRRVGKTYLINNVFNKEPVFKVTAVLVNNKKTQLNNFADALSDYSKDDINNITDWFSAFKQLRSIIANSRQKRKLVFIDEMPWFDTKGSQFIPAFEHFCNGWASSQNDIILIVCGSSTSWIVKKLFRNRGGLHNRVTKRILLEPFTLAESLLYAKYVGLPTNNIDILENYMICGGIPYYLNLMDKNKSMTQNINQLFFTKNGELRNEFDNLYASLFRNASRHILIVEALGKKKSGLTREEIKNITKIPEGWSLTETLDELELSGFIRKYSPFMRKKKGTLYQLVDHFTLFHLAFIKNSSINNPDYWIKIRETQTFRTWRGYAFEQVCLSHITQIQRAIGISAVITNVESWRSEESDPAVQIDLLINRNDEVISLCEMKFSDKEFAISRKIVNDFNYKREVLYEETDTRKAIHTALITPIGVKRNIYFDNVQSIVTLEDLIKR
jgi:AAA+ ATPase superfamily predicted ATPase